MDTIIFDCESTGIEAGSRIIELAAQRIDATGKVLAEFCMLADPGMPLPADAQAVNRITAHDLHAAPNTAEVLTNFLEWIAGAKFGVAHFASYDVGLLSWELERAGLPMPTFDVICTCDMAKAIKQTVNNKLATVVEHYGIKTPGDAHRALADTDACRQYYVLASQLTTPIAKPWTQAHRYADPVLLPAHLADLPRCVAGGTPIAFNYTDAKGAQSLRSIIPYGWASVNGVVQFHGMDAGKGERRTFVVDRSAPL